MSGLGNAVDVSAVVPLEVLLEVDLEVAVLVGGAARADESGLTARGAELTIHFFTDGKAAVASENPVFEMGDPSERRRNKVKVHS